MPTKYNPYYILIVAILLFIATFMLPNLVLAQDAINPHGKFSFEIDCSACHNTGEWVPAKEDMDFDHNRATKFALLGKHNIVSCRSCHLDLNFSEPKIAQDDCASCHLDVHRGQFSQTCTDCHNMQSFQVVDGRRIHSKTLFPLSGAHQQVSCASCHTDDAGGAYAGLDTDCFSCHVEDYNNTVTIDHVAQNFSTECQDCHSTIAWGPATFDHIQASNGFALLGAHNRISCRNCHQLPGFEPIFNPASDNDCFSCHEADYNDEHTGSGFPTECTTCHNVDSWDDADFEAHDSQFFPIFSGRHRGLWESCSTCHQTSATFTQFTCFSCHEHRQSEADAEHSEINGYVYDSQACYSCHSNGRAEDD